MRKDIGLLLIRAGVGITLVGHGTQKLFGWFGGHGLEGTSAFFHQVGFRPARQNAIAAGLVETGGGTLLALGLATPASGAAVAGTMAVVSDLHRPNGFFASNGGFEFPFVLGTTGAGLALTGAGKLSLDHLLGNRLARPWMAALGLTASLVASLLLSQRRRAQLAAEQKGAVEGKADTTVVITPEVEESPIEGR